MVLTAVCLAACAGAADGGHGDTRTDTALASSEDAQPDERATRVEGASADDGVGSASASPAGAGAEGIAGHGASETTADGTIATSGPTYHRDVRPILEASCVSCHAGGGEDRPNLTSWDHVEGYASLITHAVESGEMPWWRADPTCHPVTTPTRLRDDEVETITQWFAAGAAEGDPADYVAPQTPAIEAPDLGTPRFVVDAGFDFRVPAGTTDVTVCLPLQVEATQPLLVRAIQIRPEVDEIVHHAALWSADADAPLPTAENGWSCDGQGRRILGAYVPGTVPAPYPMNAATELAPTELLILELHYHHHPEGSSPEPSPPDRTTVALWTAAADDPPVARIDFETVDVSEPMLIPAGDPEVEYAQTEMFDAHRTFVGVAPHMHFLGARIEADVIRANGEEECLVAIPQWRFDRQQIYLFPDDHAVSVEPGDSVRVRCVYDNSPENQPFIGGDWLAPRDVYSGWRSTDEMCQLVLLSVVAE